MPQDSTTVTIKNQKKVLYVLKTGSLYQNQRPWMTLKFPYALCFKTRAPWYCYLFLISRR